MLSSNIHYSQIINDKYIILFLIVNCMSLFYDKRVWEWLDHFQAFLCCSIKCGILVLRGSTGVAKVTIKAQCIIPQLVYIYKLHTL